MGSRPSPSTGEAPGTQSGATWPSRPEWLAPLLALGEGLAGDVSLAQAGERALEALLAILPADGAGIFLEGRGAEGVRVARGLPQPLDELADLHDLLAVDRAGDGLAAVPVLLGRERIGFLLAHRQAPRRFERSDLLLMEVIAGQLAQVGVRLALVEGEIQARLAAGRSAAWVERIVRVTAKLSSAVTVAAVADVIVSEGFEAIGPDNGALWLLDPTGSRLEMLRARGFAPEMKERFASFPVDDDNPLCHAVRGTEAVWIERWEDYLTRFSTSEASVRALPRPTEMAFACLPLCVEGQVVGGLAFTFLHSRRFTTDERTFIGLLANECARGIERARLYDQALLAVRLRDDFMSVAGHELRTPLSSLLLQAEVLLRAPDEAPVASVRDRAASMLRSVVRLIKLVDDLLDTSRITTGRLQLHREPLELGALVREVVARATGDGLRGAATVHLETPEPVEGQWDRARLEQVVINLLTNALKYGRGEPVEVRVASGPEGALLSVRDHGIGIAAADQRRIFERFERAASAQQFGGLGLGLWITREIVEAHGGQISVTSAPGAGATFLVALPLSAA